MNQRLQFESLLPLLIAALLYAASAGLAAWASPDAGQATGRLSLLLLGVLLAAGIGWWGRSQPAQVLGPLGAACAFVAAALALVYPLTVDWAALAARNLPLVGFIADLGAQLQAQVPGLGSETVWQKNMIGGALAILLPLSVIGLLWAHKEGQPRLQRLILAAQVIGLGGLVLTLSRGAWLGLLVGGLYGGYALWRFGKRRRRHVRRLGDTVAIGGLLLFGGGYLLALGNESLTRLLDVLIGGTAVSRQTLWLDTLGLIGDYRFVGSGLSGSEMIYSTYVFLLHVPYLYHAHNLYLQIGLEQGLPGLIGFMGLVIGLGWRLLMLFPQADKSRLPYLAAAAAAFIALLVHGMVDAELYIHWLVPLCFLPFGFVLALTFTPAYEPAQRVHLGTALGSALPVLLVAGLWFASNNATRQANLAAVAQSKVELAAFIWPDWPLQDALRRSDNIDMEPVVAAYQAALISNPNQVTALRRLGQIELSQGNYAAAFQHLSRAHTLAPNNRATRQLLGELYALDNNIAEAARLWNSIDTSAGQLELRHWWHQQLGAETAAANLQEAINQTR